MKLWILSLKKLWRELKMNEVKHRAESTISNLRYLSQDNPRDVLSKEMICELLMAVGEFKNRLGLYPITKWSKVSGDSIENYLNMNDKI
jgi:hypothetical protein